MSQKQKDEAFIKEMEDKRLSEVRELRRVLKNTQKLWKLAKPILDGWDDSASQARFTELHNPIGKIEDALKENK